ncbi:MAG: acetolactate synthase [Candidatus Atribacteria bacterium]|nr:acetolactate synthase [Candidatus Atribacteria bacterium]
MKQISIFLENKPGSLFSVLSELKKMRVNLRALSLADTAEFGVLRFIADQPETLVEQLRNTNFTATLTEVLVVGVDDTPGGLADVVEILTTNALSIEYLYAFVSPHAPRAYVVLRVEDITRAREVLKKAQASVMNSLSI